MPQTFHPYSRASETLVAILNPSDPPENQDTFQCYLMLLCFEGQTNKQHRIESYLAQGTKSHEIKLPYNNIADILIAFLFQ